ncbi:MAG: DNA-3-methyladenine glycosylase [Candidatus Bathyarchaeota archaeon]|jgi:DNA-3-methyladenine glycosylase
MLKSESVMLRPLQLPFYSRDTAVVARDLLGKSLVRKLDGEMMEGVLVETEAYYGLEDPASRAFLGMKEYNRLMWGAPGVVFVYNVHRYWMFNIVAHEPDEVGAVLVRAVEPTVGTKLMLNNRPVDSLKDLTSGPGKLTIAFAIDKSLNGASLTRLDGEVSILNTDRKVEVASSRRIGVTRDLERNLRFYAKGNPFVSR